jgi:predicted RecB family nuclease
VLVVLTVTSCSDILPLLAVKGVGVRRARALASGGIGTVEALANAEPARIVSALGAMSGPPSMRLRVAERLRLQGWCGMRVARVCVCV